MGLEPDLVEQVAELLAKVPVQVFNLDVAAGVMADPRVEDLQRLVGLLQQVAPQAGVGLLAVPRAALAQRPHQVVEAHDGGVQTFLGAVSAGMSGRTAVGHRTGPGQPVCSRTTRNSSGSQRP